MFYDTSTQFAKSFSSDIILGLHIHSFLGPLELGIWTHNPQHLTLAWGHGPPRRHG